VPTDAAVRVTIAGEDDWRAVRDLRLAALLDAPDAFCSTHAEEAGLDEAAWRTRTARGEVTTLLAWRDASPVGMTLVTPWDEPACVGLAGVWVAPAGRGHGVGDALLRRACEVAAATGARRLLLEVGDHNTTAQQLYARHGFTPTGRTSTFPPPRAHVTEHQLARDL
jgi:ribosomal protein S18 acetylase RimI-like enzyme